MSYLPHMISLTDGQKKKIIDSINNLSPVKIKFTPSQLNKQGNIPILLTKTQINRMKKAASMGKGVVLSLSSSQMRANKSKNGGIIPFLVPIAVAGVSALATGALSALGGLAVNKIANALDKKEGGNIMNQGLPPGVKPNDMSMMPIGGSYSIKIGGCSECGRSDGDGLYPTGVRSTKGNGLFPNGVTNTRGNGIAPTGHRS